MRDLELSRKRDNMYLIASIPSIISCVIISLFYASRLGKIYPPGGEFEPVLWDSLTYFMTPIMIIAPLLFIITFEILDHQRTKDTFNFRAKRLVKNVMIQFIAVVIFISVYIVSLTLLLPFISAGFTLALIGVAWALLFYAVIRKLKKYIGITPVQ